jgi:uncharacterized phage-associated protein
MGVLKLVKLVYFADRAALLRWGRPITFDWYVSMPHGPVASFLLDRINFADDDSYFRRHITERRGNEVELRGEAPRDQLSPAEERLLDEIYGELGGLSTWDLRDRSHLLPEWQDPQGSSAPIQIRDILRAEGFGEEQIREIEDALDAEAVADELLN